MSPEDWTLIREVAFSTNAFPLPEYARDHGFVAMVKHLAGLGVIVEPDSNTPMSQVMQDMRAGCRGWLVVHHHEAPENQA